MNTTMMMMIIIIMPLLAVPTVSGTQHADDRCRDGSDRHNPSAPSLMAHRLPSPEPFLAHLRRSPLFSTCSTSVARVGCLDTDLRTLFAYVQRQPTAHGLATRPPPPRLIVPSLRPPSPQCGAVRRGARILRRARPGP